jgi:hypothetical protein
MTTPVYFAYVAYVAYVAYAADRLMMAGQRGMPRE